MFKITLESSEMSEVLWASDQLRRYIAPAQVGPVKARIRYAASKLHWGFSRAKSIWYADPRVALKPRELRDITAITGDQFARTELTSVETLIARADALAQSDGEGVYSAFALALRAFVSAVNRSRTEGK